MAEPDVTAVAALEAAAFPNPWSAGTFHRLLSNPSVEMWVAEEGGTLLGYGVLWCVLDQAELANLAVGAAARGRGVGGRILDHLLSVALARRIRSVYLEVRPSNAAARHLYTGRGFQEVGLRPDYYQQPREDALVLRLELKSPPDDPGATRSRGPGTPIPDGDGRPRRSGRGKRL